MSVPVMAAVAAGSLILAIPVVVASHAVAAGAQAAQAADAAALAAADVIVGAITAEGVSPCDRAAEVAVTNGGVIGSCEVDESSGDARVTVTVSARLFPVTRFAHAGQPNT